MTHYYKLIFFSLMIVLLAVATLHSQQAVIKLLDTKTGEPVPFAHVCFESLSGGGQVHGLTDESGVMVNLSKTRSVVAISYVGYETLYDTVNPGESLTLSLNPTIFNMSEVVVTAQYTPQRVDKSIYKVNVIGAKLIEQKASNNLSELFSDELSIRINQDGALGSSMSIRGLSGEHVKFLIDGVPVIGRMNGNIDLGQLNLNNVDHVEVIEGPMSVVYGSNALAGVVNIITKENKNTPVTANLDGYYETVGTYNLNGSFSTKIKKHGAGISVARNFFDGYTETDSLRDMTWKPKRQFVLDGYYLFDHANYRIKYSSQFFDEVLWNKGNVIEPYYAIDNYFTTRRFNNIVDYSTQIGKKRFLKVLGAYSIYDRIKTTYFKNLHTLEKVLMENDSDQDTTRFTSLNLRAEMSKSTTDSRFNYQFGVDAVLDYGSGKKIEDLQQSIGDYAVFLSLKYEPVPTLTLQPGIRVIYNTKYSAPLVYSLNMKWDPFPSTVTRISYSRGFRAPSLKELYLYFVDVNHNIQGNENLDAEDSHNVVLSLGYTYDKRKAAFGFDADLFYNTIDNIITIAQVQEDLYSYINVNNYTSRGFQVEFFYNLWPNLKWKAGLVETGRKSQISENDPVPDQFLRSTDVNTSITYSLVRAAIDFSVFYKYTGKLPQFVLDTSGELTEGYIEDYNTLDITAGKRFLKGNLHVSAGVKNLLDVKSISASGASAAGGVHGGSGSTLIGYGRTFFAGISYRFNKY